MLDPSSFAYDQQAPLVVEILAERVQDDAIVQDITYASPRGGKVPAYLILPSQEPSRVGLIFGHWGQGDRTEFVDEAIVLTRLGFVSLAWMLRTADLPSTSHSKGSRSQNCNGSSMCVEVSMFYRKHVRFHLHMWGMLGIVMVRPLGESSPELSTGSAHLS